MLVARDVEVRAGARLLLEHASFQGGNPVTRSASLAETERARQL
jgi:hypothetical protein